MVIKPIYATNMCMTDDTVAVVFDPSIIGQRNGGDNGDRWWVYWNGGTLYGTSACINTNKGLSKDSATVARLKVNNKLVVGGEKDGEYCWCRILHPFVSQWGFERRYPKNETYNCFFSCSSMCVVYFTYYENWRKAFMSSVAR